VLGSGRGPSCALTVGVLSPTSEQGWGGDGTCRCPGVITGVGDGATSAAGPGLGPGLSSGGMGRGLGQGWLGHHSLPVRSGQVV